MTSPRTPDTPARLFSAHARLTDIQPAPSHRRQRHAEEFLAEADALSVNIHRHPAGYGWSRGDKHVPLVAQTLAGAARHACRYFGLPDTVPVVSWWRVSAWLGDALEARGELVTRDRDGRNFWGCAEPSFDPAVSDVVADIFGAVRGAVSSQFDLGATR